MRFFSRKSLTLCVLTLLTLFTLGLLDNGTHPAYAASHSSSVVSEATTQNLKEARPAGAPAGCPSGYACIYPDASGSGNPLTFYRYGVYQLHDQYNYHYVYNNQTGGAHFYLCTDWNGTNCPIEVPAGTGQTVNLTPINSVKLTP